MISKEPTNVRKPFRASGTEHVGVSDVKKALGLQMNSFS